LGRRRTQRTAASATKARTTAPITPPIIAPTGVLLELLEPSGTTVGTSVPFIVDVLRAVDEELGVGTGFLSGTEQCCQARANQ
jgi:hypothetical protein